MPKYQNAYFADLDKDDDDDLMNTDQGDDTSGGDDTPKPNSGGVDWEKRYSDLRRYSQQEKDQLTSRIEALEENLESATKEQIKFPKTEEEIAAWSEKYPEVAAIVDSIARKRASEVAEDTQKRLDKLREREENSKKKTAYQELLEAHPDFDDIKVTEEFQNWVAEQPSYIYNALYKNSTDARAAARAVDLYKADTGKGKKRSKQERESDSKDAARDVASGGTSAPSGRGKAKWSDSKVASLSDAEYDKYEAEIDEARRNGDYEYDLS